MGDQNETYTLDDVQNFIQQNAQPAPAASPTVTQTASPQPSPGAEAQPTTYTFEDVEKAISPTGKPVSTVEDVARSVAAEGHKGLIQDPLAAYGAAKYYTQRDLTPDETEAAYKELTPEQLMDVQEGKYTIAPIAPELHQYQMMSIGSEFPSIAYPMTQMKNTGKQFTLVPTMKGTEEEQALKYPFTQYDSQTALGEMLGSGTRAAVGTFYLGGPRSMLPAFVAGSGGRGVGMGVQSLSGSEGAGNLSELGSNILIDWVSRKFGSLARDMALPKQAAFDKIAEGIKVQLNANPEKRDALLAAIRSGKPINMNDFMEEFLDQDTKNWLNKNLPGDYKDSIIRFHAQLAKRADDIDTSTMDEFTKIFGEDLSDNGWEIATRKAIKDTTDSLYAGIRANPKAAALWTPELQALIGQDGTITAAAIDVSNLAKKGDMPPDVIPLNITRGATKPKINSGKIPNFDYWNEVKRKLQGMAAAEKDPSMKRVYNDAANKVKKAIQNELPDYTDALASAQEGIEMPNSLKSGYDFGRSLASKTPNLEKMDDVLADYRKMNDTQKLRFQQGVGRSLLQTGMANDFDKVSRILSSRQSGAALREILGDAKFNEVYGVLAQNSVMKSTAEMMTAINDSTLRKKATSDKNFRNLLYAMIGGGGSGVGAGAIAQYMQSPNAILYGAAVLTGVTTGFLAKASLNSRERRVATEVMKLAMSQDKNDVARLGQLLSIDPAAMTTLRKFNEFYRNSIRSAILTYERQATKHQQTQRQLEAEGRFVTPDIIPGFNDGQAAGGRVGRKSGGRVANSISAEVERTRSLLSNKTASMLSMPDDAIVTALHHAKNT